MSFINQTTLIGNVGKEPEVKAVTDKGKFVRISLATTQKYRNAQGEIQTDTQWHTVYFSNGLGKTVAEYLHKGDKLYVQGVLRTHTWDDSNGSKRYEVAVYAQEMLFLTPKKFKQNNQTLADVADSPDSVVTEAA